MRARLLLLAIIAVASISCSESLGPADFNGTWGGDGVRLTMSPTMARFESPCWAGDLTMPLVVNGREFTALSALQSQGGAGQSESRSATFRGEKSGDQIQLTVSPSSLGLGPYTLTLGQQVDIVGCP